jgi:hypothetical protein
MGEHIQPFLVFLEEEVSLKQLTELRLKRKWLLKSRDIALEYIGSFAASTIYLHTEITELKEVSRPSHLKTI